MSGVPIQGAAASTTAGRLECRLLATSAPLPDAPVLAQVLYGAGQARLDATGLVVEVPLPQLGPGLREVWTTGAPPELRTQGDLTLASTPELTFGAIALEQLEERELEGDTTRVYDQILETLAASDHGHLLRVWNIVPRIVSSGAQDLDRYMLFCRARSRALERHHGAEFARRLCAASAVGGRDARLVTYFLAAPGPGSQRGNPRQEEAWRYPRRYGPRPPSFARGLGAPAPFEHTLFVSGTASIVGHQSLHPGDSAEQLEETLRNLEAVAGRALDQGAWALKVYLRDAADQERVASRLARAFPAGTPVLYLHADICRPELAIEIEGVLRP